MVSKVGKYCSEHLNVFLDFIEEFCSIFFYLSCEFSEWHFLLYARCVTFLDTFLLRTFVLIFITAVQNFNNIYMSLLISLYKEFKGY